MLSKRRRVISHQGKALSASLAALAAAIFFSTVSAAQDNAAGRWALGLEYPGISARDYYSPASSLEARFQNADGVSVLSARWTRHARRQSALLPLYGAELGAVSFKGRTSKGGGFALGIFGGVERFFSRSSSVQADAGPYLVNIADERTQITEGGLVFAVNFGINYYFNSGGGK